MTLVPVRRQAVAVLTVVAVVGLALAAAALATGTFTVGDESPSSLEPAEPTGLTGSEAATLLVLLYLAVVVFAVAGAFLAIRSGHATQTRLALLAVGLASAGIIVGGLAALTGTELPAFDVLTPFEVFGPPGDGATGTEGGPSGSPSGSGDGGAGVSTGLPAVVLLILVALIGIGVVGMDRLLRRSGPELPDRDGDDAAGAAALGRAAGRAADRFDATSVENPIYRAWIEMTDPLDVGDPRTATPADFARAAIEAGLDPADVNELTEHFRVVRYGDAPVTPDRVEAARETLRRIEATYADTEAGE